jgi:uncharacterized membrane protein (DUF2068 family)
VGTPRGRGWILAIAGFRALKAALLVGVAFGAFALRDRDLPELGERLVDWLDVDRDARVVQGVLERLPHVTQNALVALGGGALAYAALFSVEAYGLFRGHVWAEWLTIVATSSFIPFEVFEMARAPTVLKAVVGALNVIVVAYLVARRLRSRRAERAAVGSDQGRT